MIASVPATKRPHRLQSVLSELEGFEKAHGERFWPSPLLKRKVGAGHLGRQTKRGFFEYN